MNIVRCGMNGCNEHLLEEDAKFINYNNKIIPICDICDDGNYDELIVGDNHESFKKIEKIRKQKRSFND
ncbi:hypothetical protein D3C81_500690 [compost metagenome]